MQGYGCRGGEGERKKEKEEEEEEEWIRGRHVWCWAKLRGGMSEEQQTSRAGGTVLTRGLGGDGDVERI